jgi:hypothetical protein
MQLSCIHCGQEFSITAEQLGGRGRCPHCNGEIELPKATEEDGDQVHAPPSTWLENSISMLGSMVFNMIVVLLLALVQFGSPGLPGTTEEVMIGELPSEDLGDPVKEELTQEKKEVEKSSESETLDDPLDEIEPPAASATDTSFEAININIAPTAGVSSSTFSASTLGSGGGMGGSGDFGGLIQTLRRNGLDIVLTFDSTGSMSGELNQLKGQIDRIGSALIKLVPKTRISICTYRDEGDAYVVKGLPLTNDIQLIKSYLDDISAAGGGDTPEAVQEGLRWPIQNNQYRARARKVMLLFGDAPPHQQDLQACFELASDFKVQEKGVVSTITCRKGDRLSEFVEIAQYGGGEAFLTSDEKQIMTQLLVLVFGSKYRGKVMEAFEMLER